MWPRRKRSSVSLVPPRSWTLYQPPTLYTEKSREWNTVCPPPHHSKRVSNSIPDSFDFLFTIFLWNSHSIQSVNRLRQKIQPELKNKRIYLERNHFKMSDPWKWDTFSPVSCKNVSHFHPSFKMKEFTWKEIKWMNYPFLTLIKERI